MPGDDGTVIFRVEVLDDLLDDVVSWIEEARLHESVRFRVRGVGGTEMLLLRCGHRWQGGHRQQAKLRVPGGEVLAVHDVGDRRGLRRCDGPDHGRGQPRLRWPTEGDDLLGRCLCGRVKLRDVLTDDLLQLMLLEVRGRHEVEWVIRP